MSEIAVSINCCVYNHAKYLRKCLDGFVMQKTNFKFEVLIHDDASTDGSQDIIREYEEKYPDIIKPIYQTENQYSKHTEIIKSFQIPRVKGKYIAICEGDDFWTDPYKLQKQYDALEEHPEINMCACKAKEVVANTEELIGFVEPKKETCIIPVEDVIVGGGNYFATCSLFFRKSVYDNDYPFLKVLNLDYTLQIAGALENGVFFIDEDMCTYRLSADGSWSQRSNIDRSILLSTFKKIANMLECLNDYTNYKYFDVIQDRIDYYMFNIDLYQHNYNHMKQYKKQYKEYIKKAGFKIRITIVYRSLKALLTKRKNDNG